MPSKVFDYIAREQARQDATVELIASENFVSENVLRAVGSCLTNKYAEGYPAERVSGNRGRYYGGCEIVNDLEEYCCAMWKKVFHTDYHVNVQPHSGAKSITRLYAEAPARMSFGLYSAAFCSTSAKSMKPCASTS